ncbi:hypothetical protein VNI00_015365 [Paramarasmius palmivorus]|uniref:Uncharacterized protein n=1 Tax=Paramarasmius palmivorus TaxID=297713 RepID=A0AAW0BM92_9AGAR
MLDQWERENTGLSSDFRKASSPLLVESTVGSSKASDRRAKTAHGADNTEFAFGVNSGLLTEVRRLQSLLGERDKIIQDLTKEKGDLEASVEGLRSSLKQQEQSADKAKEENWNLEISSQELRTELSNSLAHSAKLEEDLKRLRKCLAITCDAHEAAQSELAKTQTCLDELRQKHEINNALARKQLLVTSEGELSEEVNHCSLLVNRMMSSRTRKKKELV